MSRARDEPVRALSRNYGSHSYAKWIGAFWRLISWSISGSAPGMPERARDALELCEEKLRPDGTWSTQHRWRERPGSDDSNVEVADRGEVANEVLTEQAEAVLATAGRL